MADETVDADGCAPAALPSPSRNVPAEPVRESAGPREPAGAHAGLGDVGAARAMSPRDVQHQDPADVPCQDRADAERTPTRSPARAVGAAHVTGASPGYSPALPSALRELRLNLESLASDSEFPPAVAEVQPGASLLARLAWEKDALAKELAESTKDKERPAGISPLAAVDERAGSSESPSAGKAGEDERLQRLLREHAEKTRSAWEALRILTSNAQSLEHAVLSIRLR
jgi:hypothetical protein